MQETQRKPFEKFRDLSSIRRKDIDYRRQLGNKNYRFFQKNAVNFYF